MITIYLLHFSEPYKHAGHYLGSAADLDQRLADHRSGRGARLLQVIGDAGITWELARTWTNVTRRDESQLKHHKNTPRLCPLCHGAQAFNRGDRIQKGRKQK